MSPCLPLFAVPRSAGPLCRAGISFPVVPLLVAGSRSVTRGSSLVLAQRTPFGLRRRRRRLPFSGVFLPGAGRASPVSMHPFSTCRRHYPARTNDGHQPISAVGAAAASDREARLRELVFTGLAQRSIPAANRVAPRPCAGFVRRHHVGLSPRRASSASEPGLLLGRDLHPLGCISFIWTFAGHGHGHGHGREKWGRKRLVRRPPLRDAPRPGSSLGWPRLDPRLT